MQLRGKSREQSSPRKVTPPSPTYMSNDQFASYITSLRGNRVARPGGARPPPPSLRSSRPDSSDPFTTARHSVAGTSILSEMSSPARPPSDATRPRGSRPSYAGSLVSRYTTNTLSGRDYYPEQPTEPPLKPADVVPTSTYIERGQRWMEKEEAFSLHQAMDHMDLKDQPDQDEHPVDDDSRLYNAALDEAAELVWQHQHGVKPPEPGAPYRYKPHLRKDSYAHARAASAGRYGNEVGATGLARDSIRSYSPSSSGSDRDSSPGSGRGSLDQPPAVSTGSTKTKTYHGIASGSRITSNGRRRSSMRRNISGEIEKPFSGDQIWEEPEGSISERRSRESVAQGMAQPLRIKTKNPPSRVQFAPETTAESNTSPVAVPAKPWSRSEIHRNPPSQSRNPNYTTNNHAVSQPPPKPPQESPTKNGMEIRGDDIRLATTMRLKDRSVKLPIPSAVSDSPGRPIVSFDKNWKAPEEATDSKPEESRRVPFGVAKERAGQNTQSPVSNVSPTPDVQAPASSPTKSFGTPNTPSICVNGSASPDVPTISVSDDNSPTVPTIMLPDDDSSSSSKNRSGHAPSVPVIVTPDSERKPSARPLPDPKSVQSNLRHALGGRPRSHWSPAPGASPRATAICHDCQLPIEGRFVALKGSAERFHPHCFRCYACGTALEALEISPEPDSFRAERLDRIRRRAAGEVLDEEPGRTMAEDGDERHRFYCHLDWHEQFAPRCKHCRTPILGEHVVALGAHWHYGHFFCAECGDPFERGMTHIEKDGYAWCVNCQTRRTERRAPKCKGCRRAVIGQYVRALGAEWHDECFRCATCGGGFDDGQIFPMADRGADMVVLCTGCRARELKM